MTAAIFVRVFSATTMLVVLASALTHAQTAEDQLLDASRNGDTEQVKTLLKAGTDPNTTNGSDWTPLMLAGMNGYTEITTLLLEYNANPNLGESEYGSALATAAVTPVVNEDVSLEVMKILLKGGANIDGQNGVGMTPLFFAAREGKVKVVKFLIENGANVNHHDVRDWTPLFMGIISEKPELVATLLNSGANPNVKNWETRSTLLHQAVRQGVLEIVDMLLKAGIDPDGEYNGDYPPSPLMLCMVENNQPVSLLLLENGANPNYSDNGYLSEDEQPRTVLDWARFHSNKKLEQAVLKAGGMSLTELDAIYQKMTQAAQTGDHKTFTELMNKGIDPHIPVPNGDETILLLDLAAQLGHANIVNAILNDKRAVNEWTIFNAWEIAVAEGHQDVQDLLLTARAGELAWMAIDNGLTDMLPELLKRSDAPLTYRGWEDQTLLHLATDIGDSYTIGLLLEAGAEANAVDRWNETPLYNAARSASQDIVDLLLNAGNKLDHRNHNGLTPLHAAARAGNDDGIPLLIERGADINARDADGWTPLHSAAWLGYDLTVLTLLNHGADKTILTNNGRTALDIAQERGEIAIENILSRE